MKARYATTCSCGCGSPITVGMQIRMYASRPWIMAHLTQYQARRRSARG